MRRQVRAVAVQPQWRASDFYSASRFERWLRAQLELSRPHLSRELPNLVVLTELNGLLLLLRGGQLAALSGRFSLAAALMFTLHLPAALPIMLRERVSPIRALGLARSEVSTAIYLRACQRLAREYGVYLVCGSAPTAQYVRRGRRLQRASSALDNQTHLFDPSGQLIGCASKVYLTHDEEKGGLDLSLSLSPAPLHNLRVFPTPAGDLGAAISLDAFKNDVIAHLAAQGCTVLLQPDANASPWTAPEGLPPDPKHLRDQPEAWLESSWQVTASSRIPYAVNPMVVGNLLDMTFDGQSAITGPSSESKAVRSYVMTSPRAGSLALMPWVNAGHENQEALRQMGRARAARSGQPQENRYRSGAISATLSLPPSCAKPPYPHPTRRSLARLLARRGYAGRPAGPRRRRPAPAVATRTAGRWPVPVATRQ